MRSFLNFVVAIVGTSQLGIGSLKARGLAALILAAGMVVLLLHRSQ